MTWLKFAVADWSAVILTCKFVGIGIVIGIIIGYYWKSKSISQSMDNTSSSNDKTQLGGRDGK